MKLVDMLDLLPDNDVGEITAADLRTIVSALYDQTAVIASLPRVLILGSVDPVPVGTPIGTLVVRV